MSLCPTFMSINSQLFKSINSLFLQFNFTASHLSATKTDIIQVVALGLSGPREGDETAFK